MCHSYVIPILCNQRIKAHVLRKLYEELPPVFNASPVSLRFRMTCLSPKRNRCCELARYLHKMTTQGVTFERGLLLLPIIYNILPCQIRSQPIQCREFRFLRCKKKSVMLETYNIPVLKLPPLLKLCRSCGCCESNTIRPGNEKEGQPVV